MAKVKLTTTKLKKRRTKTKNQTVIEALAKLQDFYELGQEVLEADRHNPRKQKYSPGVISGIAKRIEMAEDFVYKARNFAEKYSESEFQELCSLRRPDGLPLGCRHLIALLRIPEKRKRKSFQKRAAKEGMSVRELSRQISQWMGIGNDAGRQPKSPKTVEEAFMQAIAMSRKWNRWHQGFLGEDEPGEDRIFLADLPKEVAASMKQISATIEKLQAIAERKREKFQKRNRRKKR